MFVVTFIDPSGRIAGKSYTDKSADARSIGLGWRNVYPGNTFSVKLDRSITPETLPTMKISAAR